MAIRFLDAKGVPKKGGLQFQTTGSPGLTLQEQMEQEQLQVEREENPISSGLFPRLKKAQLTGEGSQNVATALDLLSLPGRSVSSMLGREKDEGFLESMANLEDGGFIWDIIRDPATGATVLTLPAGAAVGTAAKALPKLKQLSALTGLGIAEGLVGAGTTQAEGLNTGEDFDKTQFGMEVGLSGTIPMGLQLTRGLIRGGNLLFGKIAEEATGVPVKALRTASTKEGQAQLKKFAGKELALGEEMLTVLDNFDQYIPEKEIVNEALEGMGRMNLGDLRVFVERQKIKPVTGIKLSDTQKLVNSELDKLVDRITDVSTKTTKKASIDPQTQLISFKDVRKNLAVSAKVPAKNYKKLRTQIDDGVDFEKVGKNAFGLLNNKMFKVRTFMKNNLIDKADKADPQGLKGYKAGMKAWGEKLDIKESLDDVLGGKTVTRKQKAANLMGNIFSKSNKVKLGLVKKLDQITNKNFIEKAGLTELSERLGPEGLPSLLPAQKTGAALKGIAAGGALGPGGTLGGAAISSPALATKGLHLLDLLESGTIDAKTSTLGGLIGREAVGE